MAKINIAFGSGCTELFLKYENGAPRVLDYEYDYAEIHKICGGRQYYTSRSGLSGDGWLQSYRNLIPVGYYRTDVAHFDWQNPVEVADGISVMLPYQAHNPEKRWWAYPVVVTRAVESYDERGDVIVYTTLERLAEVVKALHLGKEENIGEIREYSKTFTDEHGYTTKVSFKFINIWGDRSFNPWNFMTCKLQKFICDEWEGVWGVFGLTRMGENSYCRKHWLAGQYYRGEYLEGLTDEIFEEGGEALAVFVPDWEIVDGTAARKSTRNGQGYRVVIWRNPENYRETYAPKILFDTAESIEELSILLGMAENFDNAISEAAETEAQE